MSRARLAEKQTHIHIHLHVHVHVHEHIPNPRHPPQIDILVTTPGRLIEHLEGTAGFSLEHLELLVIDEADRLLAQSYQAWLPAVLRSAHQPRPPGPPPVLASPFALYSHEAPMYRDPPEASVSVARYERGSVAG